MHLLNLIVLDIVDINNVTILYSEIYWLFNNDNLLKKRFDVYSLLEVRTSILESTEFMITESDPSECFSIFNPVSVSFGFAGLVWDFHLKLKFEM